MIFSAAHWVWLLACRFTSAGTCPSAMMGAVIPGSGMGTATKTATSPSAGLTTGTARGNTLVQTWALAGAGTAKGVLRKGAVAIRNLDGLHPRA